MAGPKKAPPEAVAIKLAVSVAHHEQGCPPREFPAGYTASVARPLALRWWARGLGELVDYEPERAEMVEAARGALAEFEAEQQRSGQEAATWERVPWVRRRLERLVSILAAEAPQEAA